MASAAGALTCFTPPRSNTGSSPGRHEPRTLGAPATVYGKADAAPWPPTTLSAARNGTSSGRSSRWSNIASTGSSGPAVY